MTAKLLLFDIDGTLVLSGGAGLRGLTRAFAAEFDVDGAFAEVAMPGRTDRAILADVVDRRAMVLEPARESSLRARYEQFLEEELERPHPRKRVLPGVVSLLDDLGANDDLALGLLTGNFPEAARIKLRYFGLWHHFGFGAFGDDALDRNDLLEIALERARAFGLESFAPADIVIVGDTPLDVACARAGGVQMVAVATGDYDETVLRDAGADVVLPNLGDAAAFRQAIGRL